MAAYAGGMVLRPTSPLPKAADVERRERSWVFAAGKRQFSFTRIEHRASFSAGHRIVVAPSSRGGWRPTAILGSMLGVLGGATLIGLAINSTRADAGYRYVVSVPVPPARRIATLETAKAHPVRSPVTKRAKVVAPAATSASDSSAAGYAVGDLDSIETTALATSMSGAIRAAMTTGHLQQWSTPDGDERGFVVVGPVEDGGEGCRALSILTRSDGDNKVESRRECRKVPAKD